MAWECFGQDGMGTETKAQDILGHNKSAHRTHHLALAIVIDAWGIHAPSAHSDAIYA